ncbi:MAG: Eco57I restriction-modification methylase domain-containing protein [Rickettsiales bacterium]|nr:Eco57I restriction-modification methylase domain-containing protein [Rickettsiales bacterium]
MHEQAAKTLIKDTLQEPYDLGRFREFASNLMKIKKSERDEENEFRETSAIVPDNFKESIKSVYRIATLQDSDGNGIDVLTVTLAKETSLDRARTLQRNFLARHLSKRDKEAALVAFVSPDSNSWRFSLVRRELSLTRNLKGKTKTVQDFSPARRFSFLVGKNEHTHTAQRQLIDLLKSDNRPSLKTLEKAFNIEQVTEEFFEEYRELFNRVHDVIKAYVDQHPATKAHFAEKDIDPADFAKRLLGQIVFLYFLQKKGWLGVPTGKKWGEGSRIFLRDLYRHADSKKQNFFHEYLQPLFYDALNRDHSDNKHYHKLFDSRIPFLNGGLFEPYHDYDWTEQNIKLPNTLFHELGNSLFGEDGRGILDVFDRYNFTVAEDEPLEREVAIDPEMLGKVFEKLLPVKERGKLGTFYTPREIVHYMCQESLIAYLSSHFPALDKTELDDFIRYGDLLMEHDSKILRDGVSETYKDFFLGATIRANLKAIDEALKTGKVCDPAIGSGAFPVGMMSEIVRARKVLAAHMRHERPSYDLKRETIQESLYGVDFDPGAIEIAKLRLWLSLVVDEDNFDEIQALPNLDYKIMQGNSLLQSYEGIKLFEDTLLKQHDHTTRRRKQLEAEFKEMQDRFVAFVTGSASMSNQKERNALEKALREKKKEIDSYLEKAKTQEDTPLFAKASKAVELAERLKKLHHDFFDTDRPKKKKELKAEIETLEWQLIETSLREKNKADKIPEIQKLQRHNVKPYFLWKLHFNEVFTGDNGGFDIVIANPPYVRQEKIKDQKPGLKHEFGNFFSGTADLYTYFYKRGVEILSSDGHLCFIAPNKFFKAGYGKNLRQLLTAQVRLLKLLDFGELPVFDAGTDPSILLVQNAKPVQKTAFAVIKNKDDIHDLVTCIEKTIKPIPVADLGDTGWNFSMGDDRTLLDKIDATGTPLEKFVSGRFYRGILTGLNEAFVIDAATRTRLIADDPKCEEIIKPWLRGKDIKRWTVNSSNLFVIFTRRGIDIKNYPSIEAYLSKFREDLEPIPESKKGNKKDKKEEKGRKPGSYKWYEIQDNIAYWEEFEQTKIIYPVISKKLYGVLDSVSYFTSDKNYLIGGKQCPYLLGILNSKLVDYYSRSKFPSHGDTWNGGRVEFRAAFMEKLPIATPTKSIEEFIAKKVLEITSLKKQNPDANVSALEAAINAEVYKLYHLTDTEIAIIEQAVP